MVVGMRLNVSLGIRRFARFGAWLAVVLALAGHVSAGASAVPDGALEAPGARLQAAMVLCVGASHGATGGQKPVHQHMPGPTLAAVGHHVASPLAVLVSAQALPAPIVHVSTWAVLPEARGPPARYAVGFYPTGPPHLI
jgi:hypothetical protein